MAGTQYRGSEIKDVNQFIDDADGLESEREKEIGQHIGYRYDLNWLEDIHMGYEEGAPAVFDRNNNGWVRIPSSIDLPDNQQDRDMIARELLLKFQMSDRHPLAKLRKAYMKF